MEWPNIFGMRWQKKLGLGGIFGGWSGNFLGWLNNFLMPHPKTILPCHLPNNVCYPISLTLSTLSDSLTDIPFPNNTAPSVVMRLFLEIIK